MFRHVQIDEISRVPKYRQIVDSIIHHISIGNLKMDEKIPSINRFSEEYLLSRDTVEKAYSILKDRKIITSIRGKGYYVTRTKLLSKTNILILINKPSSYKIRIYNAFINSIGANAHTDLFIYHCNETLFLNLMEKHANAYDYYVIMPHFKSETLEHRSSTDKIVQAIGNIPKERLVIVDNQLGTSGDIIKVYQDFENDIYDALTEGLPKIKKYGRLILVYPTKSVYPYPKRILYGFKKFCTENELDFEVIDEVFDDIILRRGDLFITIEELDLVTLVNQIRKDEYEIGKDIGVISYNETPLKELLGITVISTDFQAMGATAAEMILNNRKGMVKNPFRFIDRESV
ncbi:MAG: GntR family transcriptional regulator [Pricia sp.]